MRTIIPGQELDSRSAADEALLGKVTWKLLPFLGLLYLISYIDRQNVNFAKLQMVADLRMSEAAYGLGAGLFFIGYFLFEIPSNLILVKVGARRWFARIMLTWGLVTILLAFTQNLAMFYVLRFLLGLGEAGFFPGVLFFLSTWFPAEHRARITGLFMMFGALANAVGAPIAGLLLDLDGLGGLRGWQWVFLCTGAPAVLLAAVTLRILPDRPADARFLTAIEAARLADLAAGGPQAPAEGGHAGALRILGNRRVIGLSLFYMLYPLASFGLSYWMPTILKAFGFGNTANGFLNMAPWLLVAVALWWWPRHADRTGERRWHIVLPAALAAACLLGSAVPRLPRLASLPAHRCFGASRRRGSEVRTPPPRSP